MSQMNQQQPVDVQAIFSGLGNAKSRIAANYVRPGRYWAKINRCKAGQNRNGDSFVAIEMTTLLVIDNDEGRGHRETEEITHLLMVRHDSFLGNIKAFVANTLGLPEEEVTEENAMLIVGDDQPLANTCVEFFAVNVKTKKNYDFTQIDYKREVPISEVEQNCSPQTLSVVFPGDLLQQLKSVEAGQPAPAPAQYPQQPAPTQYPQQPQQAPPQQPQYPQQPAPPPQASQYPQQQG